MDMTDQGEIHEPVTSLLPGLVQRPPELGRIRMGEKSERGAPIRLKTFRLTSGNRALLERAAELYGGKVEEWKDAPDEGMWELTTEASELDIRIPASLAVIGQRYEFWQGGTLERGCDGTTEKVSGQACICAADGLEGPDRVCDIVTRLRVMLPRLPGLGIWRLDTSGYLAATTLPVTVRMLAQLQPGAWIPAVLRAEQRSTKVKLEDGKKQTHRFVVPVLDLPGTTLAQILGEGGSGHETPQLEPPRPPTAADKVAARRAELEAQAAPAEPGPTPELPLPRGACPVKSPGGHDCRHPLGHDGQHGAGKISWSTPPGTRIADLEPTPADQAAVVFEGEILDSQGESILDREDREEREIEDSAIGAPPVDDELEAARRIPGNVLDPIPPDVQAGLDLIPPGAKKGGR